MNTAFADLAYSREYCYTVTVRDESGKLATYRIWSEENTLQQGPIKDS